MVTRMQKFPCPLCGAKNQLSHESGSFDICRVCGWEEDGYQIRFPDALGPNKKWTFNSAKEAWANGKTLFESFPNPASKNE